MLTISCHVLAGLYFGFREELDEADGINEDMVEFFLESFDRIVFLDLKCKPNFAGCVFVLSAIGTSFAIAEFGLDGLRAATVGVRLPVVALGGLDGAHVRAVLGSGAHGVAVLGGIFGAHDPAAALGAALSALQLAR